MPKLALLTIAAFVAVIASIIIWFAIDDYRYFSLSPAARAERSPLIVYAVVNRDALPTTFVIREVWKDKRKSHSPVIGVQLWISGVQSNQFPDAAVVFFERKFFDSHHLVPRCYDFVKKGRIEDLTESMTLEQYKKACGL